MGLMDKVKQQAEQALTKAQQGVAQGQAKLDEVQAKRHEDQLLRDLGAAYYAAERTGGSREDVEKALAAVDEHMVSKPAAGAPAQGDAGGGTGAPQGDYTIGNL